MQELEMMMVLTDWELFLRKVLSRQKEVLLQL